VSATQDMDLPSGNFGNSLITNCCWPSRVFQNVNESVVVAFRSKDAAKPVKASSIAAAGMACLKD
jgi:hypothetical protein